MLRTVKFRVHVVATFLLATFVITLVAAFLLSALGRFERMAEESAQAIFDQMAVANARQLESLVHSAGRVVEAGARLAPAAYAADGRVSESLREYLLATVDVQPPLYGLYFGLDSGEFFQVIGVRGDEAVRKALDAPQGAAFALRTIAAAADGRIEHWRFVGRDGSLLGERSRAAIYDPVRRGWYGRARERDETVLVEPYLFESSGQLGVTLARRIAGVDGVMGADLSLASLADFVAASTAGQPGGVVVLDAQDRVLAFSGAEAVRAAGAVELLAPLAAARNPYLAALAGALAGQAPQSGSLALAGEPHVLALRTVEVAPGVAYRVAAFAPLSAFSTHIVRARDQVVLISLLVLGISVPAAYLMSRRASRALANLASDSERVKAMDFSGEVRVDSMFYELDVLGEAHRTMKQSIRERTEALRQARDKLESLVEIGLALSSLRERDPLLRQILASATRLASAGRATLLLTTEADTLRPAADTDDMAQEAELALRAADGGASRSAHPAVRAVHERHTVCSDGMFADAGGRFRPSMLAVPLITASGEVLGVLQLADAHDPADGRAVPFDPEIIPFVEALAAQAALALDNQNLVEGQRVMLDAVIRLVAGAIDAKSAYTGGHCERVPELALMLAEAACAVDEGPLAGFRFRDEDEWREFRIGAWLHDCGKVTTPEYVVDKATKLETLYNRIHEIRMRFEVLLRDAEIARLRAVQEGADAAAAQAAFEARRAQLQEDFAFVAECNIGGEFMADEHIERLARIAGETWLRHFDDRLGLSHEELRRRDATAPEDLPAAEALLADKPWHRVPRTEQQQYEARHGIRMKVPELLYDFGELHNLTIRRGTLSDEERFKINEHIIQTIIMLDQIPLPRQLRRVPEYAGTHHETLTGSGYPRGLTEEQLSVPARIMAVADIFEALTAADRPYKRAKTLSESVAILARFRDDRHIDADIFELFLRSGVYRRYAERFLRPEQIDELDIESYLR